MPARGTMGIRMTRIMTDGPLSSAKGYRIHTTTTYSAAYLRKYYNAIYSTNSNVFVDVLNFGLPAGYVAGSDFYIDWYAVGNLSGNSQSQITRNGVVVLGPFNRDNSGYQICSGTVSAEPGDVIILQHRRDGAPGPENVNLATISICGWDEAAIEMKKLVGVW